MKKKILSLLVTMGLAASLVPVSVFADGTEVWDGSIAESFAGGKGTKDDPYQIATGSQLAYFAKRVNAEEYGEKYADTYFELTEDIDLGGKEWTPVGETVADLIMGGHEYFVFSGNFDGNGYTIKNLTIGTETSPYSGDVCGLFGATSGTIEDVVLENVSINYVGGNHSSGYGFRMGGALVGYSMGDIVNCTVIGLDMKAGSDGSYVALNSIGGLVGIQDGGTTVSHSRVSGKIEESTKKGNVGGFVGTLAKGSSAKYCGADVSVEVTGNGRGIAVGGFVGIGNGVTTDETLIENTANMVIHIEQIVRKTKTRYTVAKIPYRKYLEERFHKFESQERQALNDRKEKKIRDEKIHEANPTILGMINKVDYMVKVEEL